MSIRLRLTLWYTGVLAATMLVFGFGIYIFLSVSMQSKYERTLQDYAQRAYQRLNVGTSLSQRGLNLNLELDIYDSIQDSGILLQLANFQTGEISRSTSLKKLNVRLPIQTELAKSGEAYYEKDTRFIVYNLPLHIQGDVVGLLQAGVYIGEDELLLTRVRNLLLFSTLLMLALAASLGWFLARKALRPIDDVITATLQIEKGADLDKRIAYEGPTDEIGRLTETINGMLVRIEGIYSELNEAYRTQRRFVSDASHELRTPLTTIRGNVDLLEKMWKKVQEEGLHNSDEQLVITREAMQDISAEAERMSRLVNDMLSLARADAGLKMMKEPVELAPLVQEVVRRAQFLSKTAEWRPGDLSVLDGLTVYGSKDYLQQLLFIFIDNAFKYTPEGEVSLEAVKGDGQIGFRISDTGIGMDKEEIPHIFERFYRADPSRGKTSGTGLGLSIAKWIIDEHRGSVEVKTRLGEGTTFMIWLPLNFSLPAE
ncbi:sensor histidine kinase [Paenibacillus sp. y28]|uniref:sensor histidine kinase n=1 Tax=Paenibacillus sp. y28 TaxID=3129110 RepID=UPI003019EB8F